MATFSIAGIIQSIDKQLYCYDTTYRTYKEALVFDDDTLKLIVVLKGTLASGRSTYKFVDMNRVLTDYLVGGSKLTYNVNNWTDLEAFLTLMYNTDVTLFLNYLTYTEVPPYQHYIKNGYVCTRVTPFKTNMTESIDIVSLGYTTDITGSYVNKDAPKLRNIAHRRASMPDLVFTKKDDDVEFDFANTLVSVDGIVCYPIYSQSTDELYACNGARFLRNTTDSNSLNILLMNFANLGTLHHYKLSECKQELVIKSGDRVWLYDNPGKVTSNLLDSNASYWQDANFSMKFYLPEGAASGIPLLCLAGRLFFRGLDDLIYYTEDDRTVIEFHITANVMENIVASNLQHQNMFFHKSSLFMVVLSYVFGTIFQDQAYEYDEGTDEWLAIQFYMDQIIPFVTIIETDKEFAVSRSDAYVTGKFGKLLFPANTKGLLMNRDTRELIDYTKINYEDQTLVAFTPQNPLFIEKREGIGTNNDLLISEAVDYTTIMNGAPETLDVQYNVHEHRYKLHAYVYGNEATSKYAYVTTYAQSEVRPYVLDDDGTAKIYAWDSSFGTPVFNTVSETWVTMDAEGLPTYESNTDTNPTTTSYTSLSWYKVLPYNYTTIKWYKLEDGTTTVTDGVRNNPMAWQDNPIVFIDPYNRFDIGDYIKDPKHYQMIDLCICSDIVNNDLLDDEDNPEKQPDPEDDISNPMTPVLTADYERVKDTISIGEGVAPKTVTQVKVEPTIDGEIISTTMLKVSNAKNIEVEEEHPYAEFDGNYKLTVNEATGTERIWQSQTVNSITIAYIPANEDDVKSVAHWAILKGTTEVFVTEIADTYSAPYDLTVKWRLVSNA